MTWTKDDTCVECGSHFIEPHDIDCSRKPTDNWLPPTEEEVRQSIAKILLRRASAECYWKEDFENKAEKADTVKQRLMWQSSADLHRHFEALWNEAVDIALGKRKE